MWSWDTCIAKYWRKSRINLVSNSRLEITLRGTQPHLVVSATFAGLLRSVNTEYLNDGSGLPSKSDHIWSCRLPPSKKTTEYGLTTGDYWKSDLSGNFPLHNSAPEYFQIGALAPIILHHLVDYEASQSILGILIASGHPVPAK